MSLSMFEEASLDTLFQLSLAAPVLATSAPALDHIKHWIGPVWTLVLNCTVSLRISVSLKLSLFFSEIKELCSAVTLLVLLIFFELWTIKGLRGEFPLLLRNRLFRSKGQRWITAFSNNQTQRWIDGNAESSKLEDECDRVRPSKHAHFSLSTLCILLNPYAISFPLRTLEATPYVLSFPLIIL